MTLPSSFPTSTTFGPIQLFHICVLQHFRPFLSTLFDMICNKVLEHASVDSDVEPTPVSP